MSVFVIHSQFMVDIDLIEAFRSILSYGFGFLWLILSMLWLLIWPMLKFIIPIIIFLAVLVMTFRFLKIIFPIIVRDIKNKFKKN